MKNSGEGGLQVARMELSLVLCYPQAAKTKDWNQELNGKLDKAARKSGWVHNP